MLQLPKRYQWTRLSILCKSDCILMRPCPSQCNKFWTGKHQLWLLYSFGYRNVIHLQFLHVLLLLPQNSIWSIPTSLITLPVLFNSNNWRSAIYTFSSWMEEIKRQVKIYAKWFILVGQNFPFRQSFSSRTNLKYNLA